MRWNPLERVWMVYAGGGKPQSTTSVTQNFSPEEAARRARVMAEAERVYGQTSAATAGSAYPGPVPVPASPDTLAAQERLRGFSLGTGADVAQRSAEALKFGMSDVLNPEANKSLQAYIQTAIRPVTQAYTDPGGVMSQVRSTALQTAGGGQGTRESIAAGIAGRSYLDTIGDVTSKIASQGYGQGLETFGRTMAIAPNTYNMMMQPALAQGAIGQQQEAYSAQGEEYAAAQRAWELNAPWMGLQNYANIVFGGAAPGTTSTSTGSGTSNVQRTGMALGGATLGFQMGGPVGAGIGAAAGLLMSFL